jgi:hypothetical protein
LSLRSIHVVSGVHPAFYPKDTGAHLCSCCIECIWFAASAVDCQIYAVTVEGFI